MDEHKKVNRKNEEKDEEAFPRIQVILLSIFLIIQCFISSSLLIKNTGKLPEPNIDVIDPDKNQPKYLCIDGFIYSIKYSDINPSVAEPNGQIMDAIGGLRPGFLARRCVLKTKDEK